MCISGGADNSIKLWDLRHQRCVATYTPHSDSVWSLTPDAEFSKVYSGGRDHRVYLTDLTPTVDAGASSRLVLTESSPVLKIYMAKCRSELWVATTSSTVSSWPVAGPDDDTGVSAGAGTEPVCSLGGGAAIDKFRVMSDQHRVLTSTTDGSVGLWNILTMRKLKDFGQVLVCRIMSQKCTVASPAHTLSSGSMRP